MSARGVLLMLSASCCAATVAANVDELAEVVVTARRVPENAAHLPLSIDVAEAATLGVGATAGLDELASRFPGLAFESMWGGANAAPMLRGLSQPSTAGDNVGVFVDDVYQAGRSAMDVEMLDLERIEIVRGPQNTQFGRSTFAGAIRYVPAPPSSEPLYRLQADLGTEALTGVRGVWSRRILDGPWLGRVAGSYRRNDGTWRSVEGESLGDATRRALTLTLATDPQQSPDHGVSLNVRFDDGRFGHPPSTTLEADDFNCGAQTAGPGYWSSYCGDVPVGRHFSISPELPDSRTRTAQAALHIGYSLGPATLRSLSSYYDARSTAYRDFDGSAAGLWSGVCTIGINCPPASVSTTVTRFLSPNVVSRSDQAVSDWSQELRLGTNRAQGLNWMLGLAASWTRILGGVAFGADRGDLLPGERLTSIMASDTSRVGQTSPLNRALVPDSRTQQLLQSESLYRTRSIAAFGMLDLPIVAQSHARLELRAEKEQQRIDSRYANFLPGTDPDPAPVRFTEFTPRLSVDFVPDAHWYGYASLARGMRSGGVNTVPGLDAGEQRYDPEHNWTTELALRYGGNSTLQGAQVTVYRVDWRNAQIMGLASTPGVNSLITANTAGITSRGIEAQVRLRAGKLFSSTLAWSLADARFRDGSDDPGSRASCGLATQPPGSDFCAYGPPRTATGSNTLVPYLDGNRSARTPRTSWNLGVQLQPLHVGADWQGSAQATLAYQGAVYERPINGAAYGARKLVGARLMLRRDPWQIALWGSNLTDERYIRSSASRGGMFYPSLPRPIDLLYGEGRCVGLSLSLDVTGKRAASVPR